MKSNPLILVACLSFVLVFPASCFIADNAVLLKNGSSADNYNVDGAFIMNAEVEGDTITIQSEVSGCNSGPIQLVAYNYFLESMPVQAKLLLDHTNFDDTCDGIWTEEVTFDLTPLKRAYQRSYPNEAEGIIRLVLYKSIGPEGHLTVDYKFDNTPHQGCS